MHTFNVIQEPPELLSDGKLVKRFIQLINIFGDDWNGDSLDRYEDDSKLFCINDNDKQNVVTKETLARRWGIGLNIVYRALKWTTQRAMEFKSSCIPQIGM
jgi:hypothetical protein